MLAYLLKVRPGCGSVCRFLDVMSSGFEGFGDQPVAEFGDERLACLRFGDGLELRDCGQQLV